MFFNFINFSGFLTGSEGYFSHMKCMGGGKCGLDMRDNLEIDHSLDGVYSTHIFTQKAQEMVANRDPTKVHMIQESIIHWKLDSKEK